MAEKNIADEAAANAAAVQAMAKAAAERASSLHFSQAASAAKKGTVAVKSLHIRKDHSPNSEGVGGLVVGNEVIILETWTDGKDTWAKLGPDQWAAMTYNGETYIKLS